jgi:hypothetical protein
MSDSRKILAFDIGIRNLAWCCMEGAAAEDVKKILGWQNYDLLSGQGVAEAKSKKVTCIQCSSSGIFWSGSAGAAAATPNLTCMRHCPSDRPPIKDLSGTPLKKLPALPVLRELASNVAIQAGITPLKKSASKANIIEFLSTKHSLPVEKVKLKKAVEHDLTAIHDAIRKFVGEHAELFRQATHILLENQPVLKNPTMKTVQILLFATLRDMLQPSPPPLKLVHAGKKVRGEETGDAGYKSRKDASEAKVVSILQKGTEIADSPRQLQEFRSHSKKSDLADAFCMCWDALLAK